MKTTFSYNADTETAKVYSRRGDGSLLCAVQGVPFSVGSMLSQLANEAYGEGYEAGQRRILNAMAEFIDETKIQSGL
jgi:hypothetical protein